MDNVEHENLVREVKHGLADLRHMKRHGKTSLDAEGYSVDAMIEYHERILEGLEARK